MLKMMWSLVVPTVSGSNGLSGPVAQPVVLVVFNTDDDHTLALLRLMSSNRTVVRSEPGSSGLNTLLAHRLVSAVLKCVPDSTLVATPLFSPK